MSTQNTILNEIISQAKQLPAPTRLQLVKDIIDTIQIPVKSNKRMPLTYGQFHGPMMSTVSDFELAEWRPTDRELDGD